jgi:hypothetical protein
MALVKRVIAELGDDGASAQQVSVALLLSFALSVRHAQGRPLSQAARHPSRNLHPEPAFTPAG